MTVPEKHRKALTLYSKQDVYYLFHQKTYFDSRMKYDFSITLVSLSMLRLFCHLVMLHSG